MPAPNTAVLTERLPNHVALVTINRPEARNAVNSDVASGLEAAVDATEADRKSTRLNSSHLRLSRMPSSA